MTIDVARSVKKMFVDGNWTDSESGQLFEATSPATGEVIAQVPKGTRADAQRAVEAAHRARSSMAKLKGFERSKRLHRIAEAIERRRQELGELLTLDQGKPLVAEALGEVDEAAEYFRIAAEDLKRLEGHVLQSASPSKLVLARHYPRGVYGIITPWNWPLTMAAELIAPALAAGNTVVWTPATSTSVISVALMECLAEADFPAGAVNLVTGPGAEVGEEVAGHALVDGVGFVGSTETGASVARRAAGKHVMLELGGNGPLVVFADADIGRAVEGAVDARKQRRAVRRDRAAHQVPRRGARSRARQRLAVRAAGRGLHQRPVARAAVRRRARDGLGQHQRVDQLLGGAPSVRWPRRQE